MKYFAATVFAGLLVVGLGLSSGCKEHKVKGDASANEKRADTTAPPETGGQERTPPPAGPRLLHRIEDKDHPRLLFISPDNKIAGFTVESISQAPMLVLYDLEDKKELKRVSSPNPFCALEAAIWSNDGKNLVVLQRGGIGHRSGAYLLDWKTGKFSEPFECPEQESGAPLAFTPKGDLLVGIGSRQLPIGQAWGPREIHVWDVATRKKLRRFGGTPHGEVTRFCLSDDGRLLVAEHRHLFKDEVKEDKIHYYRFSVRVREVSSGKEIGLIGKPREVRFDRATDKQGIYFDGNMLRELVGFATSCRVRIGPGGAIAVFPRFSSKSSLVASPCKGHALCVTHLVTGEEMARIVGFTNYDPYYRLSIDGTRLATSGVYEGKSAVCVWDMSGLQKTAQTFRPRVQPSDLELFWRKLADNDPLQAYRAMRQLALVPEKSLPFLKEKVRPAEDNAVAADTRRALWTVELLELLASPQAVEFLQELSKGSAAAWLTQEANASLKRFTHSTK